MERVNLIFESGDICMARNAMLFVRGVRGMLPQFFFKWYNLVRFGVYSAAILSEQNCKNVQIFIQKI